MISQNADNLNSTKKPILSTLEALKAVAEQHLTSQPPGYYLLRSKPRCWAKVTEDHAILIGDLAAPTEIGSVHVTYVDVSATLEPGRTRFYPQNAFVHQSKVFNASALVSFKDPNGAEFMLMIKDMRNWNAPIGRVDGDEFSKDQNQPFLAAIESLPYEKAYCALAALRELKEESGVDLSQFVASKRFRLHVYSSDDTNEVLRNQINDASTTVTTQVCIDLGELKAEEIQQLRQQCHPQEAEHIEQVALIAVSQIQHSQTEPNIYYWTADGSEEKNLILKQVGNIILTLKTQEMMPFDNRPMSPKNGEPAPWYVMASINPGQGPQETIYDPQNYPHEERSSAQLKNDTRLFQQATGGDTLNLSPCRLALHETILALSIYYNWTNESIFEETTKRIYEEMVLPLVQTFNKQFENIEETINQMIQAMLQTPALSTDSPIAATILTQQQTFDQILSKNKANFERLDTKIKQYNANELAAVRPTLSERAEHKRLGEIIRSATINRDCIIEKTVIAIVVQEQTTKLLRALLLEPTPDFSDLQAPLLRNEVLIKQYQLIPKNFYDNAERKSILVTGGAASGKGTITKQQRLALDNDVLELNPDLYKKLLLAMSDNPEEIKLHGSLTHQESSMVFDRIIDYWVTLAKNGKAPHTLIDVARAGAWIRWKLSVSTQIEVHTPVLPILEALTRSYDRGIRTGRFMPTEMLIQTHKDQVSINLAAMISGCTFTFYDTRVNFNKALPLVAQFFPTDKHLSIYDFSLMMEYFKKSTLNSNSMDTASLCKRTPHLTVRSILNYVDHMVLPIYEKQEKIAQLQKAASGKYEIQILNWPLLHHQLANNCMYLLQGLIENGVQFEHTSPDLTTILGNISQKHVEDKTELFELNSADILLNKERCIDTACRLIDEGVDYVRNPHPLWVYTPPDQAEIFDQQFPKGICLIKTRENAAESKTCPYKRGDQITFDIREFKTKEDCTKAVNELKEHGKITSSFITITGMLSHTYACAEKQAAVPDSIQQYIALPKLVRAIPVFDTSRLQYIKLSGKPAKLAKDGWIKCSEEDVHALSQAVQQYRQHPNEEGYQHALLQSTIGRIYDSGPNNIEDGYQYYVSQTALREVLTQLLQTSLTYVHHLTRKQFLGIQLIQPLTLSKIERTVADSYLLLPKEESEELSRTLGMISQDAFDLDKLPRLDVLTKDDLRRTYYLSNPSTRILIERDKGIYNTQAPPIVETSSLGNTQ